MKLDRGQGTTPVPWPIHSRPTRTARRPRVRMGARMRELRHGAGRVSELVCRPTFGVVKLAMIRSWRNAATRKVWEGQASSHFRGIDADAAVELLVALDAAGSLRDLSPLRSLGLHKLKG